MTEYTLYIQTGECLVGVGLSLGMLGSWVLDSIFYEWMWRGDEIKKKSQEGCTKLAHVKSYNRVVLQKEELWIFIFVTFFTQSFQTSNGSSLLLRDTLRKCQNTSSQCLSFEIKTGLRFFPLDGLQYGKYLYTSFKFYAHSFWGRVTRVCTFSAAAILALQNQVLPSASSSSIFECLSSLSLAATGQCNVSLPTSARFSSAFSETRKVAYFILWTWEVKSRLLKEWESTQCTII